MNTTLYRLDLKRRMVAVFNEKEGRFVEQGRAEGRPIYMYPPHWFADGSFLAFVPYYTERGPYFRYYQRIR
ncbi:MAG: hypothetical protein KatS3mg105_3184 [Gemmatales bacterium]|nr:MAG: hypothetical protein KatS3mg105_3184 [Gemmatales bacterium]